MEAKAESQYVHYDGTQVHIYIFCKHRYACYADLRVKTYEGFVIVDTCSFIILNRMQQIKF